MRGSSPSETIRPYNLQCIVLHSTTGFRVYQLLILQALVNLGTESDKSRMNFIMEIIIFLELPTRTVEYLLKDHLQSFSFIGKGLPYLLHFYSTFPTDTFIIGYEPATPCPKYKITCSTKCGILETHVRCQSHVHCKLIRSNNRSQIARAKSIIRPSFKMRKHQSRISQYYCNGPGL